MAEGSWVVKQSVGTTPVLIGHKLATHYTFTPSYCEVDVDIGSNSTANYITGEWASCKVPAFHLFGGAPYTLCAAEQTPSCNVPGDMHARQASAIMATSSCVTQHHVHCSCSCTACLFTAS